MTTAPQSASPAKTIVTTWDVKHVALAILATASVAIAWTTYREEIHDRSQMEATISTQEQQRKHDQADLSARLAAIEKDKTEPKTPVQIVEQIPQYIPLPQPLQLQSLQPHSAAPPNTSPTISVLPQKIVPTDLPDQPRPRPQAQQSQAKSAPVAVLSDPDLKALYTFGADCQECQLKLADAQKQITELTTERDAAVKAVKGGSFWTGLKRNTKWFMVGAGVGAAALCGTGDCK